jgi:hypothetical protein
VKPRVFIHTNEKQWVGALVSQYSLRRNSAHAEDFDVEILHVKDFPFLAEREGQPFLRGGAERVWRMDDLQSFTPLRFKPPERMGYEGRAVVIDPDVFAVGDIFELLTRDMEGKAVMGRPRFNKGDDAAVEQKAKRKGTVATSVMLLDCARLEHWRAEEQFAELFTFERDYKRWIGLLDEPGENIGLLEREWNDFDRLTPETRLLHNTKRRTQPWKTGLPVDYTPADKFKKIPPLRALNRLRARVFGDYGLLGRYAPHPDPNQERFFFGLLRECLEKGIVAEDLLRDEMKHNHVRHDALEVIDRTPALPA